MVHIAMPSAGRTTSKSTASNGSPRYCKRFGWPHSPDILA